MTQRANFMSSGGVLLTNLANTPKNSIQAKPGARDRVAESPHQHEQQFSPQFHFLNELMFSPLGTT